MQPMAKNPRKPGPSEPDEAVDLLRALARRREADQPAPARSGPRRAPATHQGDPEDLDSLRELAASLDRQLRSPRADDERAPPRQRRAPLPPGAPTDPSVARSSRPAPRQRGGRPRHQWEEFVAALPPAAALIPYLGRQQEIFAVVSAVVLAVAAAGSLIAPRNASKVAPSATIVPPLDQPSVQSAPSNADAATKAMSNCDKAAARDPDALFFLILPLVQSNPNDNQWRNAAMQTVGKNYLLLSAKDAINGLRASKLALRPGRYTFAALDPASGATYSWTSATGMSTLAKGKLGTVRSLKLGFDFSQTQAGAQWSAEFKRERGSCYWVSVLVN